MILIFVEEVNEKKRFIAYFSDNTTTKFGQTRPKIGTYLDHGDKKLRTNYIKRHLKDLKTNNYKKPGYLSMFILWNKDTIDKSIDDFNGRLKHNNWSVDNLL
jgi:hypothetical protein